MYKLKFKNIDYIPKNITCTQVNWVYCRLSCPSFKVLISNKMAVVASRFDPGIEFSRSEAELQDHVLDVYGTREHEVDLFR